MQMMVLQRWLDSGLLMNTGGTFHFTGMPPYVHLPPDAVTGTVHVVPSFISKADMNGLKIRHCPGRPHLIQDMNGAATVVERILERATVSHAPGDKVLGFDIEYRPNFRPGQSNPPSVVQVWDSSPRH
jgi:hypothetical protein